MRMRKFFYALGIGCMLSACSSHDELAPEDKGEIGGNANYISIALVTAGEDGTRAEDYGYGKSDLYDKGTDTERSVKSLRLYFFDRTGNCVYQKNFDEEALKDCIKDELGMGSNPAVSTIATVEVELSYNSDYHSVVAVLNPATKSEGEDPNFVSLTALKNNKANYGNLADGGKFTMSNSVYYPTNSFNDEIPSDMSAVVAVPIYSDNIYTYSDPEIGPGKKYADLDALRAAKAVSIFVERVCSKVSVKNTPDFTAHFVDKDDQGNKTSTIKVMGDDGTEKDIEVFVDFKGMALTNMAATSKVIKELPAMPKDGTSPYSFCPHVTDFKWNNPANYRTHWEEAGHANTNDYKRPTWNDVKTTDPFTKYINPNTQDATKHENDNCDRTTKLIVCAQLKFKENGVEKELDLVKYSGGFWLPSKLINQAAVRVIENLGLLDLATVTVKGTALTANEQALAKAAIEKITVKSLTEVAAGNTSAPIYLQKLDGEHDYLAELTLMAKDNFDLLKDFRASYTTTELDNVSEVLRSNINSTLSDMTNREIQYWKKGMTYFYVPIRHVGFPGLYGDIKVNGEPSTNYLNGVVRNHSYSIEIESVYGLGTPVIDPTEEIDPERPDDAPESYMTAKIHVLKWRLVSQTATLH